jgi:hypothetical protein
MDRLNKFLIILAISGVITLCFGISYIPSRSGNLPPGETPEQFSNRQQQEIYRSNGFKATMIGTGITVISVAILWIRSFVYDCRQDIINQRDYNKPRSILKVKRVTIMPEPIKVVIEDPKPQVRTTPNLGATAAPSSSPPIQFIPHKGPVIQHIKFTRQ